MKLAITIFAAALAFSAPAFARGGGHFGGANPANISASGGHFGGSAPVTYNISTVKGGNNGTNTNTGNNGMNTGHNGMNTKTWTMHGSTLGIIHHVHLRRELRRDREEIGRLKFLILSLRHKVELKTATPAQVQELRRLTRILERIDFRSVQIATELGSAY